MPNFEKRRKYAAASYLTKTWKTVTFDKVIIEVILLLKWMENEQIWLVKLESNNELCKIMLFIITVINLFSPLSANPTKWLNTAGHELFERVWPFCGVGD